jgi:hypothetical protein
MPESPSPGRKIVYRIHFSRTSLSPFYPLPADVQIGLVPKNQDRSS